MSKSKKFYRSVRFLLEYIAIMSAYWVVRFLPHRLLYLIANFASFFMYLTPPLKKLIIANLNVAFPEKQPAEIRRIARRNMSNLVLLALEFFWFIGKDKQIDEMIDFPDEPRAVTEKFAKSPKGAIWVTPHIGNWELAGLKFKKEKGLPFAVVVRKSSNPYLNKFINSGRMSEGTRVITARGAVKGMMKALKDGYFVATLIDQNTKGREGGIFIDFFGLPVATSRAPALFARKMNVPVAIGGCIRKGKRYEMFTRELPKAASKYGSDEELIQAIMDETERVIRQYPDQYLWLYERWRFIPEYLPDAQKSKYPYYSTVVTPRFYDNKAPKPTSS